MRCRCPCTPTAHDSAVAAISHMPLIVSAALVEAVAGGPGKPEHEDWQAAEVLAATGWAGMTRLARGEPGMGAGIAATNSAAIASRLRDVRKVIDAWLAELERDGGPDADALLARFASGRDNGWSSRIDSDATAAASSSTPCPASVLFDGRGTVAGGRARGRGRRARAGRHATAIRAQVRGRDGPLAQADHSRTSCCATAIASS